MGRLPAGRGMSDAPNAVHSIDKWRSRACNTHSTAMRGSADGTGIDRCPGLLRRDRRPRAQEGLSGAPGDVEAWSPERAGHRRRESGLEPRSAESTRKGQPGDPWRRRRRRLRQAFVLAALCGRRLPGPGDVRSPASRAGLGAEAPALPRHSAESVGDRGRPARPLRLREGRTGRGGEAVRP